MMNENPPPNVATTTDATTVSVAVACSPHQKKKKNINIASVPVAIRAKKELDRKLLVAATEGDIAYLESIRLGRPRGLNKNESENTEWGTKVLRDAVCVSGCTLLHWAAGSNQVGVLAYLLSPLQESRVIMPAVNERETGSGGTGSSEEEEGGRISGPAIFCDDDDSFRAINLPVTACKKSLGRTPLHYACRNGCLEAVRWLVLVGGASIGVRAKQGVTPFQLAVWQNRLDICVFLTEADGSMRSGSKIRGEAFDPAKDFNDFGCGAVHWLGIAPESRANFNRDSNNNVKDDDSWYNDGRDLLPLARWLASMQGIDFSARQRQNHTCLHKASWGGHLALVKYLHKEHDMWDEVDDHAGNYAASLADMAHTPKHARIANYLRSHCSRKRAESLALLGLLTKTAGAAVPGKDEIRKAYLVKARQLHPDRLIAKATENSSNGKDAVGEATVGDIATHDEEGENEAPPSVTFDELRKAYVHLTEEDGVGDQSNPAHSLNLMLRYVNNSSSNTIDNNGKNNAQKDTNLDGEDNSFFKARLVAVLLEYGDKGIDLSNVKKKWKQVWPEIPFPSQQQKACQQQQQQAKKIPMAEFLLQKAGDVIRFERRGEQKRRVVVLLKNRNSSKESVLRSDSLATGTMTSEARKRQ